MSVQREKKNILFLNIAESESCYLFRNVANSFYNREEYGSGKPSEVTGVTLFPLCVMFFFVGPWNGQCYTERESEKDEWGYVYFCLSDGLQLIKFQSKPMTRSHTVFLWGELPGSVECSEGPCAHNQCGPSGTGKA